MTRSKNLRDDPACARALTWIEKNSAWVTDQQIHLTEIPAPEFEEAPRAEYLKKIFEAAGLNVQLDKIGNVIGERAGLRHEQRNFVGGASRHRFPAGTDVRVKRKAIA